MRQNSQILEDTEIFFTARKLSGDQIREMEKQISARIDDEFDDEDPSDFQRTARSWLVQSKDDTESIANYLRANEGKIKDCDVRVVHETEDRLASIELSEHIIGFCNEFRCDLMVTFYGLTDFSEEAAKVPA